MLEKDVEGDVYHIVNSHCGDALTRNGLECLVDDILQYFEKYVTEAFEQYLKDQNNA